MFTLLFESNIEDSTVLSLVSSLNTFWPCILVYESDILSDIFIIDFQPQMHISSAFGCKTQNGLDKNQVHWFLRFHLQKIIIYSMQVISIIIYLGCLSWPKNIQYFMRIHHSKFLSHTTNKKMGQTPSRFWLKGIDVAVLLCDKF